MCDELIDYYVEAMGTTDNFNLESAAVDATLFTLFHESGRALVDILDLAITGREEDVVDEFATVLVLRSEDE